MKLYKKYLLLLAAVALALSLLISCSDGDGVEQPDMPDVPQSPEVGQYMLSVVNGGGWLVYERDDVYEEGDIIKFHTYVHPIPIDMYVDGVFYSSGTRVSLNEYDDYIEYRYVMPSRDVTVEFKSDLLSSSSFLALYKWLGLVQYRDYQELIIERGPIGASSDVLPERVSISYVGDIYDVREALKDMEICEVSADSEYAENIEGGSFIRYTFVTADDEYEIYVENNRLYIDGKIFVVFGDYPMP